MTASLTDILPDISYLNGFLLNGKVLPFYSFCQSNDDAHWSEEMTGFIAETSKDHFIDRYNRKIVLEGLKPALEKPEARYIDIGCGPGYLLEDVMATHPSIAVFGSDYVPGGLLQCHKTLPQVPLFQMDITQCKFPDHFFDAVSCLNVLEHVDDDRTALKEIRRILKPGGLVAITVPMAPSLYDFNDEVHFHVRRYRIADLKEKCRAAGLDILQANHFGVFIYPAFYIRKKLNQWLYGRLPLTEKHKMALAQAQNTRSMKWMEQVCEIEYRLGKRMPYPVGIRAYIVARKS